MASVLQQTAKYTTDWLHQYRSITVVGLGVTGLSVVRFLVGLGLSVQVQDSRDNPPGMQDLAQLAESSNVSVTTCFGEFDQEALVASDLLVVSPGVALATPEIRAAMDAGVKVIGDIDILVQSCHTPIIAITGSNGKSTVTELVGAICRQADMQTFVGGNIGVPALEIFQAEVDYDVAVLELSSFQLETTGAIAAASAVVLNVSQDHLDRYASMSDYLQAKLRIFRGAKHVVVNRGDELLQQVVPAVAATSYGMDKPVANDEFGLVNDKAGEVFLARGQQRILPVDQVPLVGQHNIANALAAMALVAPLDIPIAVQAEAIKGFAGLPHRMQNVRVLDGVTWINDSKATNIGATQAALSGIDAPIVLLAGGQGKGGDFSDLLPALNAKVRCVLLFGEDAEQIRQVWQDTVSCECVASLQQAVLRAREIAAAKEVVLLSPACASFDMFNSYEHRGEQFIQMVEAL